MTFTGNSDMDLQHLIGITLIGITLFVVVLAFYALRRKDVPGARTLFLMCIVSGFYTFGYAGEVLAVSLRDADFWSKIQYIGLPLIPSLWVMLAFQYAGVRLKHPRLVMGLFFLEPLLTFVFRLTSDRWHLHYDGIRWISNGYFQVLDFGKGPWYYFHFVFFLFCAVVSATRYLMVSRNAGELFRAQAKVLMVASLMPLLSIVANLSGQMPLQLDSGPFFVLINYGLFAWGIFRYNFLSLIPLSRELVFEGIQDGVLVLDTENRVVDFNPAAARLMPELTKQVMGVSAGVVLAVYPDLLEGIRRLQQFTDTSGEMDECETAILREGRYLHFRIRLSPLYQKTRHLGWNLLIGDVTRHYDMLSRLQKVARTDMLTGLNNRAYFVERVLVDLERAQRNHRPVSMIMFDVDHFKKINDRWGHPAGDEVLRKIAFRAAGAVREHDLVARYGGEEFVVFLPDTGMNDAMIVAERIRECLEGASVSWEADAIQVTASFGVAGRLCEAGDSVQLFDDLVREADTGLYRAKNSGRNKVCPGSAGSGSQTAEK